MISKIYFRLTIDVIMSVRLFSFSQDWLDLGELLFDDLIWALFMAGFFVNISKDWGLQNVFSYYLHLRVREVLLSVSFLGCRPHLTSHGLESGR